MRLVAGIALACGIATGAAATEISDGVVKLGVLNDMSSVYADVGGMGAVHAARLAAEDVGSIAGARVEIVFADHLNKPDVGVAIARQWLEVEHVDAIVDVPTSSVALAIQDLVRDKKRIFLISGGGSSDLTGKACSPYGFQWTYDTYALSHGTAREMVKQGADTWFFITADYAFGHALERDASDAVTAAGGKVLGAVRTPLNTNDFSSFLLQAQASQAKVVGFANAGHDTVNAIKQAVEFGLVSGGQKLAGMLVFLQDVHSLGLATTQGLTITSPWYWDQDDASRAFARRFMARSGGTPPSAVQAGVYSAVAHYLKAVAAIASDDADRVAAQMRATPINDFMTRDGVIREDGRILRDMYLERVKAPAASKYPFDYFETVATIPASEAWRPLKDGGCPYVKAKE